MGRFENAKVLLTGGGSGIGRATALRLAAECATVFSVDVDHSGTPETERILRHQADVSDESAISAAVRAAAAELGGIDVVVNVAGIHRTTPIAELTVEDLRRLYDVNLIGTALCCREALPQLPDGRGVIVNVSSSSATHGNPYMTAYSASKAAVLGFSLSLAAEVVGRGVRVVVVSPGTVATPLVGEHVLAGLDTSYYSRIRSPMGAAEPDQIAATIAFAASADAGYLTGAEIRVDGGSHI
ncbi:SDR family NAD(P)-dependent oxidoreductase [Amycolatopsis dendrobii]|uniref:SDR family oxidoreductase n=1 Tax=Amycolatopsis dendrobii TaxID=2760662 RepID=A0A7W3ZCX9_9PSEU|nr:SDR family oxidoreductase [Amycolatopsis dendrobii]MBB1156313.1 SDR family oxidoreductase [Amycolatopsis dendrobii]